MHRAKQAVAASITALAAFLLVGGPSPATAVARPGDSSHSHGGRDADRGGNRGRDGGPRNDSRRGEGNRPANIGKGNGLGRGDGNEATGGSTAGSGSTGKPSAATATTVSRAPQAALATTGDSEPATASPSVPTAATAATAEPSAGSGLSVAAPDFVAPKVTFGNGRIPGEGAIHPVVSLPQPGVTVVALPAAVVPAPVPLAVPQAAATPAKPRARLDLAAARGWESARPGQPMSSWFGLAGLLLIPLGGAALGYRQARAAKSASRLPVH